MKISSFKIAICLLSIPRLFASLLFWPIVIGLSCAVVQITISSAYIKFVEEKPQDYIKRVNAPDNFAGMVRNYLFSTRVEFPEIMICRWTDVSGVEQLPEGCQLDPLDVAINTENAVAYDPEKYVNLYKGNVKRIHLCKNCKAEITIKQNENNKIETTINSLRGIFLYGLVEATIDKKLSDHFVDFKVKAEEYKKTTGTIYFYPSGFNSAINFSKATVIMLLIINSALMILVTLWLLILGHRKVLQYFSRNDVLLPLVAACGKKEFYAALWYITIIRVTFFLMAAFPATAVVYSMTIPKNIMMIFTGSKLDFFTWIIAIFSSLGLITLISSVAELKHRNLFSGLLYKFVPMVLFLIGCVAWFLTVFIHTSSSELIQKVITVLPIVGLTPIILSPLFKISFTYKILHFVVCLPLIAYILRKNISWFAAHLDEV